MKKSVLPLLLLAAACGGAGDDELAPPSARELYDEAIELLNSAAYEDAIDKFRELEASYPNSAHARQAIFDAAYAHYRQGEYERAIGEAERFIKQHPDHPRLDYAYYLKGLSYFREDRGILDYVGRQDPAERDRRSMLLAYDAFQELARRYPDSKYAEDAALRVRYLINAMARHELAVARYYLRREAHLAAAARAKRVIDAFPDSVANEAALAVLARAYAALDLQEERQDALNVLRLNFPDSEFLEDDE